MNKERVKALLGLGLFAVFGAFGAFGVLKPAEVEARPSVHEYIRQYALAQAVAPSGGGGCSASVSCSAASFSTSGTSTADNFVGTGALGGNVFAVQNNSGRIDFGAGANDYASSNGTTVTFAGPVATTGTHTATIFSVTGTAPAFQGASAGLLGIQQRATDTGGGVGVQIYGSATTSTFRNLLVSSTSSGSTTTFANYVGGAYGGPAVATGSLMACNNNAITASATGMLGFVQYDSTVNRLIYCDGTANRQVPKQVTPGTATIDFASIAAGNCATSTITVTGAADGDIVKLGVPNAANTTGSQFTAWVSASDTVTVKHCCISGTCDPGSGSFRATVEK